MRALPVWSASAPAPSAGEDRPSMNLTWTGEPKKAGSLRPAKGDAAGRCIAPRAGTGVAFGTNEPEAGGSAHKGGPTMKFGPATAVALALSGTLALVGGASEPPCDAGCELGMKACVQTARMSMPTCKVDCRTKSASTALGACMRGCTDRFRSSKDMCRSSLTSCLGSCNPPPSSTPASGCVGGCGQTLGTCAQGVVTQARACLQGCRTAAERLSCLQGCASAAQQGAAMCASDFAACLTGCGVPPSTTTTTSPRGPACEASAPACGGTCPDSRQTCMAVSATLCVCVGGGGPAGGHMPHNQGARGRGLGLH